MKSLNPMRRSALACLLAITLGAPFDVFAQDCDITVEPQYSHTVDPQQIKDCIDKAASDPPTQWSVQMGKKRGVFKSYTGNLMIDTDKPSYGCPQTTYRDVIQGCIGEAFQYPQCTAKPGGQSVAGGAESCAQGEGAPTRVIFALPNLDFPGFGLEFPACLDNFLSGVQQWFGSGAGFLGHFATNVTVTGSTNVTTTEQCASGSVSFCGFGLGGDLCLSDDGESVTTIKGADIILGTGHYQGRVVLPNGVDCVNYPDPETCVLLTLPNPPYPNPFEIPSGATITVDGDTITIIHPDVAPAPGFIITLEPGQTGKISTGGSAIIDRGWVIPR